MLHPCSFCILSFFSVENFFDDPSSTWIQHWKPVQALRRPREHSRELFVQIYRFYFACLLQNILTESLVMYYIQIQTQKQVKQNEQNFISHRFCRKRRYVACVMKVLRVVVSLQHLSRRLQDITSPRHFRGPPRGFREQGKMTIYFQGTRDILK